MAAPVDPAAPMLGEKAMECVTARYAIGRREREK